MEELEKHKDDEGWFSRHLLNGLFYVANFIFKHSLTFVQYLAKKCFNYLFNLNFINKYLYINEEILSQIKNILNYVKKIIPFIKPNFKLFLVCIVLYFLIFISIFFNFITVLLSPYCVYIFVFLNLILLISIFFYNGSDSFFNMLLISDNLKIFIIYFTVIIA